MSSFFAGLITGDFIGIVLTLLVLMIVSGIKGPENAPEGQVPNRKVFLAALVLLAVCGACYTLALEKSALLALLLSVLLIAKLGGSKRGIPPQIPIDIEHGSGAGGGNRTHGLGIMRPSLYH